MRQLFPVELDDIDLERRYDDAQRWPVASRPHVTVSATVSVDGAALHGGSPPAAPVALLRQLSDVVVIGAGAVRTRADETIVVDDGWRARRLARGQQPVPTLAVVSDSLDLPWSAPLLARHDGEVLLLAPADAQARSAPRGEVVVAGDEHVDVTLALQRLFERGMATAVAEGGASLIGSLARADLVDELSLVVAPALVGGALAAGVLGQLLLDRPRALQLACVVEDDGSLALLYRRAAAPAPSAAPAAAAVADERGAEVFAAVAEDLDYPMLIVTVANGDERSGCLVGFAAQCSIAPPRFMVWLSKKNRTLRVACTASVLGVHFVPAAQRDLAALFGSETGDRTDKFARCRWETGVDGVPVLSDCPRWFAGRILERLDSGDHVAFMLEPVDGAAGEWSGQLGFQAVRDLTPGHGA